MNFKFWKRRRVFVTGPLGLLGSEVTRLLVDAGAGVVALVRDDEPYSRFYELGLQAKITKVQGGLEDILLLERVINEYEIDTIFHLGAQAIVGTAKRDPLSTFESNIRGTYNLLEAARRHSNLVRRIVVSSSDKAYGAQSKLPYSESAPLRASAPYDVSKACGDLLALSYFNTYKLPVCISRCGNFFGPGDLNFSRIIPGTIQSLYHDERPIIRGDGKHVRDYIYAGDGALALVALVEQMESKQLFGEVFNFSYGKGMSVRELVDLIAQMMGKPHLKPVVENRVQAQDEIKKQYLSSAKARRILKWKHEYGFDDSLAGTIRWYERYFERRDAK